MTQKQPTKTLDNTETSNVIRVSYTAYAIEGEGDDQSANKIGLAMTDGITHKLYCSFKNQIILRKPDQPLEGVSYLVNEVDREGYETQVGVAVQHKDKQGYDLFGLPQKVVLREPKSKK
ncbi:hypothetical protein [Ekhidna sp.]|uniref:hypothetical protein n=1 Tax=Ekhidna sp. TaxID=2608089 RepID=UPI0032EEE31D